MVREERMMMVERLLLTEKDAAKALSVSDRALRTLRRKGEIPSVYVGCCVRYYVDDLRAFIERQTDDAKRAAWLEAQYPGVVVFDDGSVGTACDGGMEGEAWPA